MCIALNDDNDDDDDDDDDDIYTVFNGRSLSHIWRSQGSWGSWVVFESLHGFGGSQRSQKS